MATYHGLIFPGKTVLFNLRGQGLMRPIVFGHDKQPAGVLVDTVNDARTENTIDSGKTVAAMIQQGVYQRPPGMTGGRVDHHALGLIHHQQIHILINDRQGDGLRPRLAWLRIGYLNLYGLSGPYTVIFGAGNPVHSDQPLLRPKLYGGTGYPQGGGQITVKPLPRRLVRRVQYLTVHWLATPPKQVEAVLLPPFAGPGGRRPLCR